MNKRSKEFCVCALNYETLKWEVVASFISKDLAKRIANNIRLNPRTNKYAAVEVVEIVRVIS